MPGYEYFLNCSFFVASTKVYKVGHNLFSSFPSELGNGRNASLRPKQHSVYIESKPLAERNTEKEANK